VFRDFGSPGYTFKVLGVVSAFQSEKTPVLRPVKIERKDIKAEDIVGGRISQKEGQFYRFEETDERVESNTGIVVVYNISHAMDLIKKNPVGPKVDPAFR